MALDPNAPVTARGQTRVDAPPEVVWDVMSTIADWPRWNPDVRAVELAGPLRPGTSFRWRAGPGWITSTLREVRERELLEWTGSTFGVRAVHVWRIEADGDGSMATTEESWSGLPARLLRRRSQRTLDQAIGKGLEALRLESERRSRGAA